MSRWTGFAPWLAVVFLVCACRKEPREAAAVGPGKTGEEAVKNKAVGEELRDEEKIEFTAKLMKFGYIGEYAGKLVPTHFDTRFFITVEVISCRKVTGVIFPDATVTFGIHSLAMTMGLPPYQEGEVRKMSVVRDRGAGETHYSGLMAQEVVKERK